jgi:hypothetical protein
MLKRLRGIGPQGSNFLKAMRGDPPARAPKALALILSLANRIPQMNFEGWKRQ